MDKEEVSSTQDRGWRGYWDATEARPPRPTLLRALDAFSAEARPPGLAVDLGCGVGRDTVELVRRGWRVIAVDGEADALARLGERLPEVDKVHARIEDYIPPPADLVNASFSLFFLGRTELEALWHRHDVLSGGRLAGHLLGPRDDWALDGRCTGLSRDELDSWLAGWEVEMLDEEESDTVTPRGEAKHWHLWHLVLRRPS